MNANSTVWLYTQFFDPEPFLYGDNFVKEMMKRGCNIEVITGFPNHPTGQIYPNYRLAIYDLEVRNNVKVHRTYIFPNHSSFILLRLLNYLSFFLSSSILFATKVKKGDTVLVYQPPIFPLFAAALIKKFVNFKLIAIVQDVWPETLLGMGATRKGLMYNLIKLISAFAYKASDLLAIESPGFIDLLAKNGVDPIKTRVVHNWCHEKPIQQKNEVRHTSEKLAIGYAGNIGFAQGHIEIFEKISDEPSCADGFVFRMVGTGPKINHVTSAVKTFTNLQIQLYGQQPYEYALSIMLECDFLLVCLRKNEYLNATIPSKLQEGMYLGKPIICLAGEHANGVVEDARCGFTADPNDKKSVIDAFKKAKESSLAQRLKMGNNARSYYQKHFSFEKGVESVLKLVKS